MNHENSKPADEHLGAKPVRRALYHHRTQAGGVEGVHIRGVVRAFEQRGIRVDVAGPPGVSVSSTVAGDGRGPSGEGFLRSAFRWFAARTPETVFEIAEILYNLYALPRLIARTRGGRYDIIYERYALFLAAGVLTARLRHLPIVVEVNDSVTIERSRPLRLRGLARRIEQWVLRNATLVATVSRPFMQSLTGLGVDEQRIIVTPNAIDPDEWPDPGAEGRDGQEPSKPVVIGYAAAFVDWHRPDLLVETFADIAAQRKDVHLVLVGDGPARPEAESMACRLGCADRVTFTGSVSHEGVRRLIADFDIAVMANSNEHGSPMKVFEYMAGGKAIVAPMYAPIEEVLEDEETGLLFKPLSQESLKEKLVRLLDDADLRLRLGRRARERVLREHTWSQNVERVLGRLGVAASAAVFWQNT
jgi:glycosyltransferase involved in cell wall biosynthesis